MEGMMKRNACVVTTALLASVAFAGASRSEDKRLWEIEIHGGGLLSSAPQGGQSQLPPAGSVFSAFGGPETRTSRHVSSWYFGDGSALFNEVVGALPGATKITALDPVLQRAGLERRAGVDLGVRVGRRVHRKLTVEVSLDYGPARTRPSAEAAGGISASAVSFADAWNSFLGGSARNVSSVWTTSGGSRRLLASAAVDVSLATGRKIEPYVTLGGGFAAERGPDVSARLVGGYEFFYSYRDSSGGTTVVDLKEGDSVTLHFPVSGAPFGLLGFGVKYQIGPRWGIRFDAREHLSGNKASTRLAASPSVGSQTPYGGVNWRYGNTPVLQFSNYSPLGPSSLSGAALSGFETFKGTGMQSQLSVTVGVFLRF
jgi:hypothetical protein